MKYLFKTIIIPHRHRCYQETGPDRIEAPVTGRQPELPDVTLAAEGLRGRFPNIDFSGRLPSDAEMRRLQLNLDDAMGEGLETFFSNPRLQGAAALSGIDAETLAGSLRSLGIDGGNTDAIDGLAALARNFAGDVENGLASGDPNSLFGLIQTFLQEMGIEIDQDNETARDGVRNLGASTGAYTIPEGAPASSEELEDVAATLQALNEAGISLRSSGAGSNEDGTSRASNRTCLIGLRESTLSGAIALSQAVGGSLICTGGTEEGHAAGEMSHYNGYKLDFAPSAGLIQLTGLTSLGQRRTMEIGGQRMDFYRHAPDHFDVKFYPA